jgi:xanthine dehydrogenase iron-sulfur cluster and FAD-binding subunit A
VSIVLGPPVSFLVQRLSWDPGTIFRADFLEKYPSKSCRFTSNGLAYFSCLQCNKKRNTRTDRRLGATDTEVAQFMKPAPFVYHAPTSVEKAVELLAQWGSQDGRILAGGQSLVPAMAFRVARPTHIIDINGIAELDTLAVENGLLSIGACVRHSRFDDNKVPGPTGALLRKVVRNIGHYPIRTRGTFCGSIAKCGPGFGMVLSCGGPGWHRRAA